MDTFFIFVRLVFLYTMQVEGILQKICKGLSLISVLTLGLLVNSCVLPNPGDTEIIATRRLTLTSTKVAGTRKNKEGIVVGLDLRAGKSYALQTNIIIKMTRCPSILFSLY